MLGIVVASRAAQKSPPLRLGPSDRSTSPPFRGSGWARFIVATPCFRSLASVKELTFPPCGKKIGKTGGRSDANLTKQTRPRGRPSGDFCSRPFRSASIHFAFWGCEPPWALASQLCARPARTARSGGRGTLGRDLSGPAATLAARRKRRLLPTQSPS